MQKKSTRSFDGPVRLQSWPQAMLHVDADAFFASVEQSIHPELRGLPVITGAERGIVAAASYEAKSLGIKRGVSLADVKKIAPQCVLIPSDYETYSLYSKRIFSIIRRFTPSIEEYSIDEAFADITGLRKLYHCSYEKIATHIQQTIHKELDLTVSVGVSLSKSLCKIASKWNKPAGLTVISGKHIHHFLKKTPIHSVWGFGPNITQYLHKKEVHNAHQYIQLSENLVKKWLGKTGLEIHQELRGHAVFELQKTAKTTLASISKFKTFSPSTTDEETVYARLLRNLESACIKSRRYGLGAKEISAFLRQQDFHTTGFSISLSRAEDSPLLLSPSLKTAFKQLYRPHTRYRATGVTLAKLEEMHHTQFSLFENPLTILEKRGIFQAIDKISTRFGKHSVFLSPGLAIKKQFHGSRGRSISRKKHLLKGETSRQRLAIPLLQYKGI